MQPNPIKVSAYLARGSLVRVSMRFTSFNSVIVFSPSTFATLLIISNALVCLCSHRMVASQEILFSVLQTLLIWRATSLGVVSSRAGKFLVTITVVCQSLFGDLLRQLPCLELFYSSSRTLLLCDILWHSVSYLYPVAGNWVCCPPQLLHCCCCLDPTGWPCLTLARGLLVE